MQTYLVGGAVRDTLLGYPFHERDWVVVGANAQYLLNLGYQPVGSDFPVFLHPETKEEYALARTERKSGTGYTGFECYAEEDVTLEQDLLRRDLTINAMAQDSDGTIIDPYNGRGDLQIKVLRHVSRAFSEDPLRVLRLARFLARYAHLGFSIATETIDLARLISASGELNSLPAERLWKELEKALRTQSPQCFFSAMDTVNASTSLMPELAQLSQKVSHSLQIGASEKLVPIILFAALFTDKSSAQIENFCKRLKCPKDFRDLALLVSQHSTTYIQIEDSAQQLLSLLESLDAFRRQKRFDYFLKCCEIAFGDTDKSRKLKNALAACNNIDTKTFVTQGLKGQAIARAVRDKRLQLLGELIKDERK